MWDNNLPTVAAWVSVFVGLMSILMLISSFFLYAIAAGEEPKMKKKSASVITKLMALVPIANADLTSAASQAQGVAHSADITQLILKVIN